MVINNFLLALLAALVLKEVGMPNLVSNEDGFVLRITRFSWQTEVRSNHILFYEHFINKTEGIQNWGSRSEIFGFEGHDLGLSMNVFGQVRVIDHSSLVLKDSTGTM